MARILVPRLLNGFGAGLVFPFLNLFYKQRFGVSDAALGWIFGITSVTVALTQLVGGAIAERQGKIRATLVARAVATPMMLIMGFVPSLPLAAAANWVRSGLMRLGGPLYMAFVMEQLDESERATGSSLMAMTWDLGWSTAPYVSGLVQVQWGFGPLFVATTALYGLGVVCVYRFFGRRGRMKPLLQRIGK
jgi:predicted MFS family arabinose efflux permease